MNLMDMSLEELNNELLKIQLNENELKIFKSGKEMIDNAAKSNENESSRASYALLVYMIYKYKEKYNK